MSFKTLTKLALGAAITSMGFMASHAPVQASLLGDTIGIDLDLIDAPGFGTTSPSVTVGSGFELQHGAGNQFWVDVHGGSFDITIEAIDSLIDSRVEIVLSDLNWVNDPTGLITGVTLTAGDTSFIDPMNIGFTANSITINTADTSLLPDGVRQTWSFDIETKKRVPEPTAMLGLLAVTGLGLGSRFKRNVG